MIDLNLTKFKYGEIRRLESPNGRKYLDEQDRKIASVTTILSYTKDKTFLEEWRARVGNAEADQITLESASLGTMMHTHLENYIKGEPRPGGANIGRIMARNMADIIIAKGLKNVTEVCGIEVPLIYSTLWAGTTDLVGLHCGELAIMDFKSTRKPKKLEYVQDYFLQLSAYALAHDFMYDTSIKKGVIFMASRDSVYQEFVIEGKEFEDYKTQWCERVDEYYKNHEFESAES
jgi:genome maintenance exonuclease 1